MANVNEYQMNNIVSLIKSNDLDGEDIQHILDRVGMSEQILRQLVMSCPLPQMLELMDEKIEMDQGGWVTSGSDVDWINACGSI
jgi:hypothetical protein